MVEMTGLMSPLMPVVKRALTAPVPRCPLELDKKYSQCCALFPGVTGVSTVTSAERQSICTTPWSLPTRRPCSHIWRTLTASCPCHSRIAPPPAPRRVLSKSFNGTTSRFKQLWMAPLNWREPSHCFVSSGHCLASTLGYSKIFFSQHCIKIKSQWNPLKKIIILTP